MAICTNCGAIMHEQDVMKHICKSNPTKGQEKIPTTTTAAIE